MGQQHAKVNVEIQRTAKPLDQRHGTGARRSAGKPGLPDQVRGNDTVDNAEHLTHDVRAGREQKTQRIRKAQHPLAHRLFGKYLIHQQRGALGHAPGAAAGAEAAAFAAERHEMFGMTGVTTYPQEAVFQAAA
jgi:hypothetical protein